MKIKQFNVIKLTCVVAINMFFSIVATTAKATESNLIKNGNFTEGLKYWTRQGKGSADITAKNGTLYFKKNSKDYVVLRQDVKIPSLGTYLIEGSVDNRMMPGSSITIIPFINGKWGNYRVIKYVRLQPVDGGQQFSRILNFGNDVSKIRIAITGNQTGTSFYSISLKKTFARKTNDIPVLTDSPKLDGKLNEAFWTQALKLSGFRVLGEPAQLATHDTTVFIASNKDYLYVGYEANEPDIDKMSLVQKDIVNIYTGDDIELFLSTNRKEYIQFLANADGFKGTNQKRAIEKKLSSTWYDEPRINKNFDGKWQVAANKTQGKYCIEMAINLKDIFKDQPVVSPSLYMNFCRHQTTVGPAQEYTNWAGLGGTTFHAPENFPEFKLSWKNSNIFFPAANKKNKQISLSNITKSLGEPALFTIGKPIKMIKKSGHFLLPASLEFNDAIFPIDKGVKRYINMGLTDLRGKGKASVQISKWDESLLPSLSKTEIKRCSSMEAFIISTEPEKINIYAKTHHGALRALTTLALLGSKAKSSKSRSLSCFFMVDAPWFPIRGWDAGGIRAPRNLKKLVDMYFLLRLNHMQFEVSSYGKYSPFPFDSHPNISNSKYSKKEYRELADYARARGITLVPLFYCWSRAGYIFNKTQYSSLAATQIKDPYKTIRSAFNRNGNAFNPKTAKLVFDLCDELIDTMKLTKLNIGLDEVHFGKMVDQNAPYSKGKTDWEWFKTVIIKSHKYLNQRGVEMWMFSDELNPNHSGPKNEITNAKEGRIKLASLPKDITMMPWHYSIPESGGYDGVLFFKQIGFSVVGAPCWYSTNNVPSFINDLRYYKAKGIIGTTWGNALPDTKDTVAELFSAVSLLAYLSWSPENCEISEFDFVPSTLYQHIAFRFGKEAPYANKTDALSLIKNITPVQTIKKQIGFPECMQLGFLEKSFTTSRGIKFVPFSINGMPGAVVVQGNTKETISIPVEKKFDRISLLHSVNKIYNYQLRKIKMYKKVVPAIYELIYEDGTKATLELKLRLNINEWNDRMLAKKSEVGIFGSMDQKIHINIPVYTWNNPHPDKKVKSLVINSGNSKSCNLYLFAISLD